MSYSFYWDCTLPIKNIKDIVNINIVPQTTSFDEGDYLSVRGYVAIDGEYVSHSGVQYLFNERIPLDISLPKEGRTGKIETDISNFDYSIYDNDKLYLNLNLTIEGYDLRKDKQKLAYDLAAEGDEEEIAPISVLEEESIHKEAIKAGLNKPQKEEVELGYATTEEIHQNAFIATTVENYLDFDNEVLSGSNVQESLCEDKTLEVEDETKRKDKQVLKPAVIETPKSVVVETPKLAVVETPVAVEVAKPAPKPVVTPLQKPTASDMEDLFGANTATLVTPQVAKPVVKETTAVLEEEVLPFPVKSDKKVVETTSKSVTPKSKIFDLLYDLEEPAVVETVVEKTPVVVETVVEKAPVVVETVVEKAPVVVEKVVEKKPTVVQSVELETTEEDEEVEVEVTPTTVYSHFADGESLMKIVFIQEEEVTVTQLAHKYDVPVECIYNYELINGPLMQGDRVMINYGKQN
ncbi:MAG TPA: hypothetical protein DCY20_04230 [Firmicutes bacterium]|nr:hypothetical protein [Bacillota bacterium]